MYLLYIRSPISLLIYSDCCSTNNTLSTRNITCLVGFCANMALIVIQLIKVLPVPEKDNHETSNDVCW